MKNKKLLKFNLLLLFTLLLFWSCVDERELELDLGPTNTVRNIKATTLRANEVPKVILEYINKSTNGTMRVSFNIDNQRIRFSTSIMRTNDTFGVVDESTTVVVPYENETRYTFSIIPTSGTSNNDVLNLIVIEKGTEVEEYFIRYSFDNLLSAPTSSYGSIDMTAFTGTIYYYDSDGNLTGEYTMNNGTATNATGYATPCPDDGDDTTTDEPNDDGTNTGGGGCTTGNCSDPHDDGNDYNTGNGNGHSGGGDLANPDECALDFYYQACSSEGSSPHEPWCQHQNGIHGTDPDCTFKCNGTTLVVTNPCSGQAWVAGRTSTNDTQPVPVDCSPTDGVLMVDIRLTDFLATLSDEELTWWLNPENFGATIIMRNILFKDDYSDESQLFISYIITELEDSPNINGDEAEEMLTLFDDNNWLKKLKLAIVTGVTTTAELMHSIYNDISEITANNPTLLDVMNYGLLGLRVFVSEVTDTNSQTATWEDLFNIWLFELGQNPMNFDGDDATTLELKNEEGVNDARDIAIQQINQGNLNILPHVWQYGQNEFYDGMANGNIATAFLGSYIVNITAVQNGNGTVTLTFTINNTSGWESATRLRIDNDNNGQHDEIIPNKPRGTGIWLGGNFNQTWTWSETLY